MKRLPALFLLAGAAAFGTGYQYYYTDPLTSINTNNWILNGSGSATSSGFTSGFSGNLVSSAAITSRSIANYEVRMTLTLTQSGGNYAVLMRASDNAVLDITSVGTFYAVEVANPTFTNGVCSASLYALKVVAGSATLLSSTPIPCHNGMVLRVVMVPSGSTLIVYLDNVYYMAYSDAQPIASGAPGVTVLYAPSGNTISQVQLGPWDSAAPMRSTRKRSASLRFRIASICSGKASRTIPTVPASGSIRSTATMRPTPQISGLPTHSRLRSQTPTLYPAPPIPTPSSPTITIGT